MTRHKLGDTIEIRVPLEKLKPASRLRDWRKLEPTITLNLTTAEMVDLANREDVKGLYYGHCKVK